MKGNTDLSCRKSEQFSDELFEGDFMQALQPLLLLLDALP